MIIRRLPATLLDLGVQRRGGRLLAMLLGAVLLAGCASSGAQPAGGRGSPPIPAAASPTAIRLRLAGFGQGPGFRLPEDLGGRPLVLNVWASWCGPCRAEMPAFQQVYLKAKDQVGFLGLDSRDVVDGSLRGRHVGALTATELRASIRRYLDVNVP